MPVWPLLISLYCSVKFLKAAMAMAVLTLVPETKVFCFYFYFLVTSAGTLLQNVETCDKQLLMRLDTEYNGFI